MTESSPAPAAPEGLLPRTEEAWQRFWSLPVAEGVIIGTDLPALERLFWYYDEAARAVESYRDAPKLPDHSGNPHDNPMGHRFFEVSKQIIELERRFFITSGDRVKLGLGFRGGLLGESEVREETGE